MEITFLKDHLDHTAGESTTVSLQRGIYLINTKVAEEKTSATTIKKETKEDKPKGKRGKKAKVKDDLGTKGIVYNKTPEEADEEIKQLNKNV